MRIINCDRCGLDITTKRSSAVHGIRDADEGSNGISTETAELCAGCYRAVWKLIGITPRMPRARRDAAKKAKRR